MLDHGEVHHHLHPVAHGCPVYCGILPIVIRYCNDGMTEELYRLHLVAVHHAIPAVPSQPNPQDAPLVFDIELIALPPAVGAHAGQVPTAPSVPAVAVPFTCNVPCASVAHPAPAVCQLALDPLLPFLATFPVPLKVHFTNILYPAGSSVTQLFIVRLL